MSVPVIFFTATVAIFFVGFVFLTLRENDRKRRFFSEPFPQNWEKILQRNVPVYAFLPDDLKKKLCQRIKEFLSEKTFEPCGGLSEVSEEIAVTIAAGASILTMNRGGVAWRTLHSVLVYPDAFAAPNKEETDDGNGEIVRRVQGRRDGESWTHGSVVFSWQRILRDIALHGNGQNVIIHEFAHQLDSDDGIAGGRPHFQFSADAKAWQKISEKELKRLQSGDATTVIDEYGAENSAEFFATSVEAFFEKSTAMKRAHPELYALLARFFALNPASWNYS